MITVLYVDDEPELLEVTRAFLEQAGEFEVRISTSAREVLDSGTVPSCDAIVSDYQMPEMDGIAFLKEVRERFADLPFILFTGRGREEVAIEALNYGADFYIQKGGEPRAQFAELSNKIRYAVSRKRAEKELRRKNDELNASYEQIAANEEELRQQLDELTGKQDALKNSEEKFRAFTENIPDLTTIVDLTGVYTYISPSIQRITGRREGELLGKKFGVIDDIFGILPDGKEILLQSGRIAMQKPGEAVPVPPFRIRDFKGDTLFIEGTNTYLPFVKGIQGIVFHGRDISDRVRAEEELRRKNEELNASYEQITASDRELRAQYEELALIGQQVRESEEKFRGIFEKIHDALTLFTEDGCIDCNRHALELYGFPSKEELRGMLPADVSPPVQPDGQDSQSASAAHIRAVLHKGVERFEWLHRKKDGSTFLADILLSSFELDGRQVFLSSVRDVTERKRMEDELRLLKISVERSSDEVFWMDFDGSIFYVNDAACRITGYSRDELCSMKFFELDPDVPPEVWEQSVADLRERKTQFITTRHRCKNGTIIDVEIVAVYVNMGNREYSFAFVRDITERKRAERDMQNTIAFLNAIIEQNPSPAWISDEKGFLIRMNPACRRMLHSTEKELAGKYTILNDNLVEKQGFMPLVRSVFEEGKVVTFPLSWDSSMLDTIALKEKVNLSLEVTIFPVKDTAGKLTNAVIIHNDISERMRAEGLLAESEEKYRTLVEKAKEVIAIVQDWTIVFANRSGADLLGVPAGDLVGKPFMDYIWPEDRERIKALHSGHAAGDTVADAYDFRIIGDGGRPVWVIISSAVISWKGRPATLSLMTDITERKFIEGALRESEETFRRVIEGAPDAIYIGTDGKFMFLNPAALRLFGATSGEQLVGTPFLDRIHPKHHDTIRERVHQRYDELLPTPPLEEVYLKLDGTPVDVEVSSVPFRYMGRDGALVFIRDITERKSMEQAIQEANRKLNLLNSISRHDIANQLTVLQGYAQLAAMKDPDPVIADFLKKIEATADTITRQIEFTKTYQELGVKTPAWFRLDETVERSGRAEVKFSNTCRPVEIYADPMLERVFYNLFENAIRHGGHVTEIAVRCEREPDGLVVIIEDNGVGVVPEEKEKIFEKGFGRNTGFGLFLAREILAITGITIRETGYAGIGARFEITVPTEMYRIAAGP
ncbi:MAG: PAS domain S-box protein [Methanoregula sp.]|nr:PAS domain S-box protein [Methanoregula sp.]